MKYVSLQSVHPEDGSKSELYVLDSSPPTGISKYEGYTILNFGSAENSVLVMESPEEIMSIFGITLEERKLN